MSLRALSGCCVLGAVLMALPSNAVQGLREFIRGGLVPGQKVLLHSQQHVRAVARQWASPADERQRQEIAALRRLLAASERRVQVAQRELLIAQDKLEQQSQAASPIDVTSSQPLFAVRALEARVIGRELAAQWKAKRLVIPKQFEGLQQELWVLEDAQLGVDQGEDSNVVPGQTVFAGRAVVGCVAEAGRLVSAVELITSTNFRKPAVVGRQSGQRLAYSQPGLLVGDGDGRCRLTLPDRHTTVSNGDAVYAVTEAGGVDVPLLLGYVESATLGPLQWDVLVRPAADLKQLDAVQILTTTLNPERLHATR